MAQDDQAPTTQARELQAPSAARTYVVSLPSGRQIRVHAGDAERLTIVAPDERVELSVELTARGPVLTLSAASLQLAVSGTLKVDCDRFEVDARESVELRSGGAIVQSAQGELVAEARGSAWVNGLNVNLNCERPAHKP